jgi:hypothetical protein
MVGRNGAETLAFVANQLLPLNRLLQPGDVTPASWYKPLRLFKALGPSEREFVGRYATGDIAQGVALRRETTDAVPNLAARQGGVLVIAGLSRAKLDRYQVNAETCVHLDGDAANVIKVRAVLCPAAQQAQCAGVLDVASAQLASLQPLIAKAALSVADAVPCR